MNLARSARNVGRHYFHFDMAYIKSYSQVYVRNAALDFMMMWCPNTSLEPTPVVFLVPLARSASPFGDGSVPGR